MLRSGQTAFVQFQYICLPSAVDLPELDGFLRTPCVVSVNVGEIRSVSFRGRDVSTGFFKKPVADAVQAGRLGFRSDHQADLSAHGGSDMALYAYPSEHLNFWGLRVGRTLKPGAVGENLTTFGLTETNTRMGDVFRIGSATVQVSQPRIPCFKLTMAMGCGDDFAQRFLAEHKLGWYFRVLEDGMVSAGDTITCISSDTTSPTVAEYIAAHQSTDEPEALRHAIDARGISNKQVAQLRKRLFRRLQLDLGESWSGWQSIRVAQIEDECNGVKSFHLERIDGQPIRALPGQFMTISLPSGTGVLSNPYSISGHTASGVRISVARNPIGSTSSTSNTLHDQVREGDQLRSMPPMGTFAVDPGAKADLLLIAAGIGITPFLPMLSLIAKTPHRRAILLHSNRFMTSHAFREEVEDLAIFDNIEARFFYTGPKTCQTNEGKHGRISIDNITDALSRLRPRSEVFICGTASFNSDMEEAVRSLQVPGLTVLVERFVRPALQVPMLDAPARRITFARSEITVDWDPAAGSILDFAEGLGLTPAFGCRAGTCETCAIELLSGRVRHTELVDVSEGQILACCAIPESDLIVRL